MIFLYIVASWKHFYFSGKLKRPEQCFQRDSYYVDINIVVTFQCVYVILSQYRKELERDIQLSRTQTSANSERDIKTGHNTLLDEGKLIHRDPHCQSCRAKNTIYLKLHHDNIDRDSGIEIPEPWQPHDQTTADSGGNNFFLYRTPTMLQIEAQQRTASQIRVRPVTCNQSVIKTPN